jgi:hypothetical protein
MTGFPQLVCTTRDDVTPRLCRDGPGLPRQWHVAALAGAVGCWRSAVAQWLAHERFPRDTWPRRSERTSLHGADAARQGRSVARAEGPRHRRPRLRHDTHRRGDASAASRPLKAHARVVEKVCLSAQPPADRSVQRLMQRRHWTAPAHRWAARRHSCPRRRGNALEWTLRLASPRCPPRGTAYRRIHDRASRFTRKLSSNVDNPTTSSTFDTLIFPAYADSTG